MKLTILFLTVVFWHVSTAFSQNITLNEKRASIKSVFSAIEAQTGFVVFYNKEHLQNAAPVSVDVHDMPLKEFLDLVLRSEPVTYEISQKDILIKKKPDLPVKAADDITGIVRNGSGQPVAGAVVKVKRTGLTVTTDADGRFTVPAMAGDVLTITSSGHLPYEVLVGKEKTLQIVLSRSHFIGSVMDSASVKPMSGVSVGVKGSLQGTSTDKDGHFELDLTENETTLLFTYVGYKPLERKVQKGSAVIVQLAPATDTTGEVVVVAYGKQKKSSMVASITSIDPKELKGASSNITTMLAGRVAGLISFQQSGEPGKDNASFFVRGVGSFGAGKVDPLILIDGMESTPDDLARLQPDDLAGFSVLKDAAASALYGARGANGVILVNTKTGVAGKAKFNVRAESNLSENTQNFKFADNVTYMKLADEAVLTRDPLGILPYDQNKIDHTAKGDDPLQYPSNNWINQLIKPYTVNEKFDMNVSGGAKAAQYYISGTYNIDNGVLRSVSGSNVNNNIKLGKASVRSNVTLNITPTTTGVVRTSAQFDDYTGPINGGGAVFNQAVWSNPVMFPAAYPASYNPTAKHVLFGNNFIPGTTTMYNNPYANMVSGFQAYNTSTVNVQIELSQNWNFVTPGLASRFMMYTQRYGYFDLNRSYSPFYYNLLPDANGKLTQLNVLNPNSGTEYLGYNAGTRTLNTTTYAEFANTYNRTFNKVHAVGGMVIGIVRNYLTTDATDLQSSLPARNMGVSGRFTYAYDSRYLTEFNFGYNGSERFAANHRFGFFPSGGLAWNVANEKFFEPLITSITRLKFRLTYGLVGNDQIGSANDRFFYLSNVTPNDNTRGYHWGASQNNYSPGYSISRYANNNITWEQAQTANLGMDLTMRNGLDITVDLYHSTRSNILMQRTTIPQSIGAEAPIYANVGKASTHGVDLALEYKRTINNHAWIQARGTLTYAASKYLVNEEPHYPSSLAYLSHVGKSINQTYGYIAERLFVDDAEAAKSPVQSLGGTDPVRGGDIKYRDVNGDGQITDQDMVPLGWPTIPEITYGFGVSVGYKAFDFNVFFQGLARVSFFIAPHDVAPFALNGSYQNGLLKQIADDHWSEDNPNPYAFWPRLSGNFNTNNTQTSSWWLRNGSFLRLKTAEIGYTMPQKMLEKIHFGSLRIYVNGQNLAIFSPFKLWDPEMGGNGLGYPVQSVYNAGVMMGF
jgi:TonB-linked SusC/RagA family outer membrane protein